MTNKITEDPRIDPRIKALFGAMDLAALGGGDVASRDTAVSIVDFCRTA